MHIRTNMCELLALCVLVCVCVCVCVCVSYYYVSVLYKIKWINSSMICWAFEVMYLYYIYILTPSLEWLSSTQWKICNLFSRYTSAPPISLLASLSSSFYLSLALSLPPPFPSPCNPTSLFLPGFDMEGHGWTAVHINSTDYFFKCPWSSTDYFFGFPFAIYFSLCITSVSLCASSLSASYMVAKTIGLYMRWGVTRFHK
jgi:hypothetical protein